MVAVDDSVQTLSIAIGCDIGQQRDPTAIAVCEETLAEGARRSDALWGCHYLQRLPLGTSYVGVAECIAEAMAGVRARTAKRGRGS